MSNTNSNRRTRSMLFGLIVLVVFGAALFVALTATDGLPGSSGTVVKAAFTGVDGLLPGNDVRIAGIRVGQVRSIDITADGPVVTMQLDDHRPVYRDASATVADKSALGEKYVALTPGQAGAGLLAADAVIPRSRTSPSQDLSDLLQVLDAPTRDALRSTVQQVGGGAVNHTEDLRSAAAALPTVLPDLGTVARALSADSGAGTTQLLQAANGLATSFAGSQQRLTQLLTNLSTTLSALNVNSGQPLSSALDQAPAALAHTRGALADLQGPLTDTQSAMTALRPGATALGAATPDIRGVLTGGVDPMNRLTGVDNQALPAVDALTTTVQDARPLSPLLAKAITTATHPLAVIAPYSPEISQFFTYFSDAMKYGDAAGHWLRIYPPIDAQSVTGLAPIQDPTASRDAYPPPGVAQHEKQNSLLGTGGGK